jgi:protein O-GlcNAc transferase
MIQAALNFHRQGRLSDAERLYRGVLAQDPGQFDALHLLGVLKLQQGDAGEAFSLLSRAVERRPDAAEALSNLTVALLALNRHQEALAICDRLLAANPSDVEALYNRAVALTQLSRLQEALESFDKVLAIKPSHANALFNRGNLLAMFARHQEALVSFDQTLALNPGFIAAAHNRGNVLLELERFEEALIAFAKVLAAAPDHLDALNGRAVALKALGRYDEALASCGRMLSIKSDHIGALLTQANVLIELRRPEEALAVLDKTLAARPDDADVLSNRGFALGALNRHLDALESCDRALAIRPDDANTYNNRGNILYALGRKEDALASYEQALRLNSNNLDALCNRARGLGDLGLYNEAIADYEKLRAMKPDFPNLASALADCQAKVCNWPETARSSDELRTKVVEGTSLVEPLMLLGVDSTAEQQLACAKNWLRLGKVAATEREWNRAEFPTDRLRIAYFSADYHRHATAHLISELFEIHDRERFEIIGVSFGPDDGSQERARLIKSFDRFVEVTSLSDEDVAKLVRELKAHIAVDLKGHTSDARRGIFAHRPAPIQANYLGYPGSSGADYIDYVIADKIALPFDQEPFYTEKIVHLPGSYQVNDSKRPIASRIPDRRELGLPETGFVFCCFNNSWKIQAPMFDAWMRLLRAVPGSVLWLYGSNDAAVANLRREAEVRGVDPARLVFAPHVGLADHLARLTVADLVLDTLPYNAHTTASDALWAGVPVLTCQGHTFPGRVAASLLHAIGLPELVTANLEEYEALALKLAREPDLLRSIRNKVAQNRDTHPLFDTNRFRRHIEQAYTTMWDIWQRGEAPRSFAVEPIETST